MRTPTKRRSTEEKPPPSPPLTRSGRQRRNKEEEQEKVDEGLRNGHRLVRIDTMVPLNDRRHADSSDDDDASSSSSSVQGGRQRRSQEVKQEGQQSQGREPYKHVPVRVENLEVPPPPPAAEEDEAMRGIVIHDSPQSLFSSSGGEAVAGSSQGSQDSQTKRRGRPRGSVKTPARRPRAGERSKSKPRQEASGGSQASGVAASTRKRKREENRGAAAPGSGSSAQENYFVERVVDKRVSVMTGLVEYMVKWRDYPESENTWEPAENVADAEAEPIQEFEDMLLQRRVIFEAPHHVEVVVADEYQQQQQQEEGNGHQPLADEHQQQTEGLRQMEELQGRQMEELQGRQMEELQGRQMEESREHLVHQQEVEANLLREREELQESIQRQQEQIQERQRERDELEGQVLDGVRPHPPLPNGNVMGEASIPVPVLPRDRVGDVLADLGLGAGLKFRTLGNGGLRTEVQEIGGYPVVAYLVGPKRRRLDNGNVGGGNQGLNDSSDADVSDTSFFSVHGGRTGGDRGGLVGGGRSRSSVLVGTFFDLFRSVFATGISLIGIMTIMAFAYAFYDSNYLPQ